MKHDINKFIADVEAAQSKIRARNLFASNEAYRFAMYDELPEGLKDAARELGFVPETIAKGGGTIRLYCRRMGLI